MSGLLIEEAGMLMTVQDSGRIGWAHLGVPHSGPMDWFALCAANRLIGNPYEASGLEWFAAGSVRFIAQMEMLVAVTGVAGDARLNGYTVPLWTSIHLRRGDRLSILKASGNWLYLAVQGGIDVPVVMGSQSTCLASGFGGYHGKMLENGDDLDITPCTGHPTSQAGKSWPEQHKPPYAQHVEVGCTTGPHFAFLEEESQERLFSQRFSINPTSNRTGYRLDGEPLKFCLETGILSEGVVTGSIQVPGNGLPIVLMADHQTVGGYPIAGCVCRADLPLLAQAPLNEGNVRLHRISRDEATVRFEHAQQRLRAPLEEDELW
jgi:biotin-dependent carboxylase-like uncharacterized protein